MFDKITTKDLKRPAFVFIYKFIVPLGSTETVIVAVRKPGNYVRRTSAVIASIKRWKAQTLTSFQTIEESRHGYFAVARCKWTCSKLNYPSLLHEACPIPADQRLCTWPLVENEAKLWANTKTGLVYGVWAKQTRFILSHTLFIIIVIIIIIIIIINITI